MACVCHYTTVNYNTLGTLVKTIGGELSGLYGSQIPADFNVFHKTPSYFFFVCFQCHPFILYLFKLPLE